MARSVRSAILRPLEAFLALEGASGIILLAGAAIALLWANSPWSGAYERVWAFAFPFAPELQHAPTARFWVNDGLMTFFFFVVGLEIKRELSGGELRSIRVAVLPIAGAAGGILAPAAIYLVFVSGRDDLTAGWAIPTATDIAFALAVLHVLGSRVPQALRVLLLTIAIIDDIAAVVFIAVVYSEGLSLAGALVAAAAIACVVVLQVRGVGSAWVYALAGCVLWAALLAAGIHPTLAGVALGLLTPMVAQRNGVPWSPVESIERTLHPWVAFGVMPLFALANAGVSVDGLRLDDETSRALVIAIVAALVLGKPLGIFVGVTAAVKLRLGELPISVTWGGVIVVGCLGGIGFTMSIFIGALAFGSDELLAAAKLGVLVASAIAGLAGVALGRFILGRAECPGSAARS